MRETSPILLKPFLKWTGGKRQLMPEIKKRLPESYERLIEPFVGAGSVFLSIKPQVALLNDYNSELINAYNVVKANPKDLAENLDNLYNKLSKEQFLELRSWDREEDYPSNKTDLERATRTLYLNRTCFNGMYRVNSKGHFNVPFNSGAKNLSVDKENMNEVSSYLQKNTITFTNEDYKKTLLAAVPGDFVYVDPPYDYEDGKGFTAYTDSPFGRKEQGELAELLNDLTHRDVKWMFSNNSTSYIRETYSDYKVDIVGARRSINSKGDSRGKVDEVIIRNY